MSDLSTSGASMRLGTLEFRAMNTWIRRWAQRSIEFSLFRRFLVANRIDLKHKCIVDAGCGSGYSSSLIRQEYEPARLFAFDYMPEQIAIANARYPGIPFTTGDIRHIASEGSAYDAVFVFGVLHHVPEWMAALREMGRVLKPGGVLLLDEPRHRFTWEELERGIQDAGFDIRERAAFLFGYFHSYLALKN